MTDEVLVREKKKLPTRCAICRTGALATRLRVTAGPFRIDWYQLPSGWWTWGDIGNSIKENRARCHHCMIARGNHAMRRINNGQ